jgi:hypothetical protein
MKISKMMAPAKGISTAFIAGDWHTFALNMPTYNILIQHALHLPPEMRNLIINGDFLDAPHIMPRNPQYKKWIKRPDGMDEFFVPHSKAEFEWGNKILDELSEVFNEIIFVYGNHDWRYDQFAKISAMYEDEFFLKPNLHLNARRMDHVDYNDWLDWGDHLTMTHGMYHGTTCHKKHYEASGGKSVIFSHVHYAGCKAFPVRGNTRQAWSLPAMCDLSPEYIRGTETNWSNGYGLIQMRSDSAFNFNTFQVWNNKLVLPDGKILDGMKG